MVIDTVNISFLMVVKHFYSMDREVLEKKIRVGELKLVVITILLPLYPFIIWLNTLG